MSITSTKEAEFVPIQLLKALLLQLKTEISMVPKHTSAYQKLWFPLQTSYYYRSVGESNWTSDNRLYETRWSM